MKHPLIWVSYYIKNKLKRNLLMDKTIKIILIIFGSFFLIGLFNGEKDNGNKGELQEEKIEARQGNQDIILEENITVNQSSSQKKIESSLITTRETTSQKNVVLKAKSYLDYSAFSYSGLVDQLRYEGFTQAQAEYGADNSSANWNEQAIKKAQSYLDYSAFSYSGLVDQLKYEGFTQAQAEYGANSFF